MTRRTLFLLAALVAPRFVAAEEGRVFELRTYIAAPGKIDALNARFKNHTLALFKKHGLEVIGFWTPVDKDKDPDAGNKLVYLLAFKSREAAAAAWKAFAADPDWVKARAASEVDGRLTTKIESVFFAPTDYSPLK